MQIRMIFCPLKSKYLKIVYEDFMYVLCITQETFLLCSKRCHKPFCGTNMLWPKKSITKTAKFWCLWKSIFSYLGRPAEVRIPFLLFLCHSKCICSDTHWWLCPTVLQSDRSHCSVDLCTDLVEKNQADGKVELVGQRRLDVDMWSIDQPRQWATNQPIASHFQ